VKKIYFILSLFTLIQFSHGQIANDWTGAGDGTSWSDGANWTLGVPQIDHNVAVFGKALEIY